MSLVCVKEEPVESEEIEWEVPCVGATVGGVYASTIKEEIEIQIKTEFEVECNPASVKQEPGLKQTPSQDSWGGQSEPASQDSKYDLKETACRYVKQEPGPSQESPDSQGGPSGLSDHTSNFKQCSPDKAKEPPKLAKPVTDKQNKFTCDECKQEFTTLSSFKRHQERHARGTPYCDICKREFKRHSNLNTHIKRKHSPVKPYTCDVCHKEFKEAYVLQRHMRMHTGERPYTCDVCNKTFKIPNHLREHKRTHTGEAPYTCDYCQKQIKHKYTLKCHILFHMGLKPHGCDICERRFIRATDLKHHMMTHGKQNPFACEKCDAQFSRKDSYYRHLKRAICKGNGRPPTSRVTHARKVKVNLNPISEGSCDL